MALAKLLNSRYAGKKLVTGFGTIEFDEAGVAKVEEAAANALAKLKGFSVQEDDSEEEMEETPAEEDSDETEQESDVEDAEDEDSEDYTEEELDKLTVPQLRKIANERGINTKDLTKKSQLIAAILE